MVWEIYKIYIYLRIYIRVCVYMDRYICIMFFFLFFLKIIGLWNYYYNQDEENKV